MCMMERVESKWRKLRVQLHFGNTDLVYDLTTPSCQTLGLCQKNSQPDFFFFARISPFWLVRFRHLILGLLILLEITACRSILSENIIIRNCNSSKLKVLSTIKRNAQSRVPNSVITKHLHISSVMSLKR